MTLSSNVILSTKFSGTNVVLTEVLELGLLMHIVSNVIYVYYVLGLVN